MKQSNASALFLENYWEHMELTSQECLDAVASKHCPFGLAVAPISKWKCPWMEMGGLLLAKSLLFCQTIDLYKRGTFPRLALSHLSPMICISVFLGTTQGVIRWWQRIMLDHTRKGCFPGDDLPWRNSSICATITPQSKLVRIVTVTGKCLNLCTYITLLLETMLTPFENWQSVTHQLVVLSQQNSELHNTFISSLQSYKPRKLSCSTKNIHPAKTV